MNFDPIHIRQQIEALKLAYADVWDEDDSAFTDLLEVGTDLRTFITKVEQRRQDAVALERGLAAYIDELKARKNRFERRDEAMRKLMFDLMQAANLKKLEMEIATLSVRTGSPKTVIVDEAALPDDMCRIVRLPDKIKIKEALTAGETVEGAVLSNAEPTIAIRIK